VWCGGGGCDGSGAKGIHAKVVENVKGNTIWYTTRIVHKICCTTCGEESVRGI